MTHVIHYEYFFHSFTVSWKIRLDQKMDGARIYYDSLRGLSRQNSFDHQLNMPAQFWMPLQLNKYLKILCFRGLNFCF